MGLIGKYLRVGPNQSNGTWRLLLHLPESSLAESLIHQTVELARRCAIKTSGLTLIDTGDMHDLANTCESAAHTVFEIQRLQALEHRRHEVRTYFSNHCLAAGLDFELHSKKGRFIDVLAHECLFYDLAILTLQTAGKQDSTNLTPTEAIKLANKCSTPLLILRDQGRLPERVLLAHDGTSSSTRSIRTFLSQKLFPHAQVRFLAIGANEQEARQIYNDHLVSIRDRLDGFEMGYAVGKATKIVVDYAQHWDADLVVVGAHKTPLRLLSLSGQTPSLILKKTKCALYCQH